MEETLITRTTRTERMEILVLKEPNGRVLPRSKKLDLEFSIDSLFKRTCADFDEVFMSC